MLEHYTTLKKVIKTFQKIRNKPYQTSFMIVKSFWNWGNNHNKSNKEQECIIIISLPYYFCKILRNPPKVSPQKYETKLFNQYIRFFIYSRQIYYYLPLYIKIPFTTFHWGNLRFSPNFKFGETLYKMEFLWYNIYIRIKD